MKGTHQDSLLSVDLLADGHRAGGLHMCSRLIRALLVRLQQSKPPQVSAERSCSAVPE